MSGCLVLFRRTRRRDIAIGKWEGPNPSCLRGSSLIPINLTLISVTVVMLIYNLCWLWAWIIIVVSTFTLDSWPVFVEIPMWSLYIISTVVIWWILAWLQLISQWDVEVPPLEIGDNFASIISLKKPAVFRKSYPPKASNKNMFPVMNNVRKGGLPWVNLVGKLGSIP